MPFVAHALSRADVKRYLPTNYILVARGLEFLTMVSAFAIARDSGSGAQRKRDARNAYARIVSTLPMSRAETILKKDEVLALLDGLEVMMSMTETEWQQPAQDMHDSIERAVRAAKKRQRKKAQ